MTKEIVKSSHLAVAYNTLADLLDEVDKKSITVAKIRDLADAAIERALIEETPKTVEPVKAKNGNVKQAVMLCKDNSYQRYLDIKVRPLQYKWADGNKNDDEMLSKLIMCDILSIKSRKEVDSGQAAKDFKYHVYQFKQWRDKQ